MEKIVNDLVKKGLHHYTFVKHPTEPLTQVRLYFAMPEKIQREKIEQVKSNPLRKTFYTKGFWKKKQTWNPFKKAFWSATRKKMVEEEPEGIQRVARQALRTAAVGAVLELDLRVKFYAKRHIDLFPMPVSGRMETMPFDPAYLVISPKSPEGEKIVNMLIEKLKEKKVKHYSPKDSMIQALQNVSGKGYSSIIIEREEKKEDDFDPNMN